MMKNKNIWFLINHIKLIKSVHVITKYDEFIVLLKYIAFKSNNKSLQSKNII